MLALHYVIDEDRLGRRWADRVLTLAIDDDTRAFVDCEENRHHSRLRWAARAMACSMLGAFSANAVFDTYPLFLLSAGQWTEALGERAGGRLLDVGAAAGHVTSRLGSLFDEVTAIDVSRPMVRRMRRRGLHAAVLDLTTQPTPDGPYDTVALLNVLDRCARPRTLLKAAIDSLTPAGALLVSMPVPYDPCWYDGPAVRKPIERLGVEGRTWEQGAADLADELVRHGLCVRTITRAPYLSGGDRRQPLYVLDAAIIVATRT